MREIANALSGDYEDLEDLVIANADYGLHINHNKTFEVALMLRQAADLMDREKKYEYSVKSIYGEVGCLHYDEQYKSTDMLGNKAIVVRREVGEWEEVSDGE